MFHAEHSKFIILYESKRTAGLFVYFINTFYFWIMTNENYTWLRIFSWLYSEYSLEKYFNNIIENSVNIL